MEPSRLAEQESVKIVLDVQDAWLLQEYVQDVMLDMDFPVEFAQNVPIKLSPLEEQESA